GGEEERLAERRQLLLECLPTRPHANVDVLPVVETRALHLTLIEREAERLDEMQRGAGGEAGATCGARVPVNPWMDEDDVNAHRARMLGYGSFGFSPESLSNTSDGTCCTTADDTRRPIEARLNTGIATIDPMLAPQPCCVG